MLKRRLGLRWLLAAAIVMGVTLLTVGVAYACEPCAPDTILDAEQTAQAADLVIVGHKVGEAPLGSDPDEHLGPDWIHVQVDEVLKGQPAENRIPVNSWDGMCPYGIVVDDQSTHLMFLSQGPEMYGTVNYGCAVISYPVQNDVVDVDGEMVSLDEFAADLGLVRTVVAQPEEEPHPQGEDTASNVVAQVEPETSEDTAPSAAAQVEPEVSEDTAPNVAAQTESESGEETAPNVAAQAKSETGQGAGTQRALCLSVPSMLAFVVLGVVARHRRR